MKAGEMNRLVRLTALGLEPQEREIVLGDLTEGSLRDSRAFFEVLGLVVWRQVLIWTDWRPWFGLIAIVGISGFCLSRMFGQVSLNIFQQLSAWRHFGVHYNVGVTSFRDVIIYIGCLSGAIFCWTAINTYVLKGFSGRAFWFTVLLFYVIVHGAAMAWEIFSGQAVIRGNPPWWAFLIPVPPIYPVALLLFVLPAICGTRRRLRGIVPLTVIFTIAAALLGEYHSHDLERLSGGAFRPAGWTTTIAPYLLVSWPVLLVRRRRALSDMRLPQRE